MKQFGKPEGFLGWLVGRIMAVENKQRIEWAVSELALKGNENILEIGFGPGAAIKKISQKISTGKITGYDISELMVKQASHRNKKDIKSGKVQLYHTSKFNFESYKSYFDKILAINVNLFWKDPVAELANLKSLLRENGLIQIVFEPHWIKSEGKYKEICDNLRESLIKAGFNIVNAYIHSLNKKKIILAKGCK